MYLSLIFMPLLGSLAAGLFGRKMGSRGACIITVICLIITCLLSFACFYEVALAGSPVYIELGCWIDSELLNVNWGFLFDSLTVTMCCVITFVSSLVHLYSTEYMSTDPHLPRFMSYLSLFTFFMLILVTADNYVQMFAGWEGVGLCSYLLINFWFTRIQSNKAAIKAMIINRIGDFGLMLGILTIFVNYQAVDYSTVFAVTPYFKDKVFTFLNFDIHLLTLVGLLLFVGSVGKSAQIGLHTWLPDAMEGPTPVSALIHAATMVTAGVFLLARSSPIFEYAPDALVIITISGAMTSFFAATVGLLQNDLKRIIAYSTCSQLGYMIFACGLSNYAVGIFHLVNHASFKALLFLGAGSVIHAVGDEQDIRKMGGLKKLVPFTYSVMMIGSLALMGFPFLTGFYSKDVILEVAYGKYDVSGHFAYILGLLAAFFTAFYSIRLIHLTFLSSPNGYKSVIFSAHDSPLMMVIPLAVLTVPSIFAGYLMKDMFIGLGTDFWGNSLLVLPENMNRIDSEFIPQIWKLMPVCFSVFGAGLSFFLYSINMRALYDIKRTDIGRNLYNFINRKWLFDRVYNDWITQPFLYFSYHISYKLIDRGILEFFGPMGLTKLLSKESKNMHKTHTGFLYHYAFIILMGGTVLLIFLDLCHNWLTYFKIIFLCVNIFLLTEYIETFKNR